jgi:cytoskeletal protein CcmA (bactofilin family)
MQEQKSIFWRILAMLIVAFLVLAGALSGCYIPPQQAQQGGIPGMGGQGPNAQGGYSVPVYMEQGGAKLVVESTGVIEIQPGGALVATPGATISLGAVSQNGNLVVTGPTAIATATPALLVNNLGAGNVLQEWRDAATPVVRINNNGLLNANAGIAVDTNMFTVADGTGNTVISGTLAVTGTSDLRGNLSDSGGAFTIVDNTLIDGAADAAQLTVQGYTTQTNSLLVLETSNGTDKFTVSNDGNLVVEGTSNLKGNISDSGGALTVADNVVITGQADAQQLVVTGYTTQTNSIFVVEQSDNDDVFRVSSAGHIGNDHAAVTIDDNLIVTGQEDLIQLIVTGYTTQTNSLLRLENSADNGVFTVANTGNTVVSGTLSVTGTSNFLGNVADSGGDFTIDDNLAVTGTSDLQGNVDLDALWVPSFADETITNGEILTPTVSVYALDSSSAVTLTLAAVGSEGQFVTLIGDDNYLVTVADTNLRATSGITVGITQYDTATFVYQGSEWLLISKSVNE